MKALGLGSGLGSGFGVGKEEAAACPNEAPLAVSMEVGLATIGSMLASSCTCTGPAWQSRAWIGVIPSWHRVNVSYLTHVWTIYGVDYIAVVDGWG